MARPAKFDDAELLDRATDLFWRDGCDAVSIRDLEQTLGLRAPSIYRRFHSKDELISSCVDRYVTKVVGGRVRCLLEESNDPIEALRSFFTTVLVPRPGEEHPRGCLLTVTAAQTAFRVPQVRASVTAGFDVIESALRTQVKRACDHGQLPEGTDTARSARGLLLSFEGLLVLSRAGAGHLHHSVDATFDALAV
jgi:TetR/AcrR family transcriptional repressor of nem operon